MNQVTLQGQVVTMYHNDRGTILTMRVLNGSRVDYPHVFFYAPKDKKTEVIKQGEYALVIGYLHTRPALTKAGQPFVDQVVIGLTVAKAQSDVAQAFGLEQGMVDYKNEVLLSGIVGGITSKNNVTVISLMPDNENQLLQLESFVPRTDKMFADCKYGAHLCAKCELHTKRNEKDGKRWYFQNVVIRWTKVDVPAQN
jgi:hypothetical protein